MDEKEFWEGARGVESSLEFYLSHPVEDMLEPRDAIYERVKLWNWQIVKLKLLYGCIAKLSNW